MVAHSLHPLLRARGYGLLLAERGLAAELYEHESRLRPDHGQERSGIESIDRRRMPSAPGSIVTADGRPCAKVGSKEAWTSLVEDWAARYSGIVDRIHSDPPELAATNAAALSLLSEIHARVHWMWYYNRPLHDDVHPIINDVQSMRLN